MVTIIETGGEGCDSWIARMSSVCPSEGAAVTVALSHKWQISPSAQLSVLQGRVHLQDNYTPAALHTSVGNRMSAPSPAAVHQTMQSGLRRRLGILCLRGVFLLTSAPFGSAEWCSAEPRVVRLVQHFPSLSCILEWSKRAIPPIRKSIELCTYNVLIIHSFICL